MRERGFPEPAAKLTGMDIWETADVERWIATHRPKLAKPIEGEP